ncbi:MAG: hypothetical protein WC781_02970 [Candidatus Pacearchaeota archaeon]|jgi:hypothetical protein
MSTLDSVNQLKQSGYSESEIIQTLQQNGISPREINDAISQSKIKEAVAGSSMIEEQNGEFSGMQPSLMNQPIEEVPLEPEVPSPYETQIPYPQETQQYGEQPSGYPQESYQAYPQSYGLNTETMSEIASQLIAEKLSKTNLSISSLMEFKSLIDSKVDKIDSRLVRIESIMDQLQTTLIRRSSGQVQDIEDIKTELRGMQNSFSKVINPLTDSIREVQAMKNKAKKTK